MKLLGFLRPAASTFCASVAVSSLNRLLNPIDSVWLRSLFSVFNVCILWFVDALYLTHEPACASYKLPLDLLVSPPPSFILPLNARPVPFYTRLESLVMTVWPMAAWTFVWCAPGSCNESLDALDISARVSY